MINHLKEDQFEKLRSAFPVQFSGCAERNAKAGRGKDREQESKRFEKCIRFPVTIAGGIHLFPYRTQKLSLHTLIVLGWKRPGRVGRRRIQSKDTSEDVSFFLYWNSFRSVKPLQHAGQMCRRHRFSSRNSFLCCCRFRT